MSHFDDETYHNQRLYERDEKVAQFIEYRAQGKSLRDCAEKLDMPLSTTGKWNQSLRQEISISRAEWLIKNQGITVEAQFAYSTGLLNKIREALSKKDWETLSTTDLYTMMTKISRDQLKSLKDVGY